MTHSFVRNARYYRDVVYEFNLPTGWTCPFAKECLVKVNRDSGKFSKHIGEYYCYASKPERFPGVRNHRWRNFEYVSKGGPVVVPPKAKAVRIHSSGDFFNQAYFDHWLEIARTNPGVEFWAYTKSLPYWINRLDSIPGNLILTASYGGKHDHLIEHYGLKNVIVYKNPKEVPKHRPIDTNDDYARMSCVNFALLDNSKIPKKSYEPTKN